MVIGIVVAVVLLWLIAVPVFAWSQIARVDAEPGGERPADQPGTTFLLVGSDSREGVVGRGAQAARHRQLRRPARPTPSCSCRSRPAADPALISVPRDSYVAIPGRGENKINAAYAFGGPELLVETVEQSTGLRIDAYTEIGFGGFVNVIDALGGIQMCLPTAIEDRDSNLNLPKGCQVLNGANALGYVRMRKADPRGDLGRVERQRQMLAAVAKEAASPLTVVNPVRYWSVLTSGAGSVAIGQDTGFLEMVGMANAMRQVSGDGGSDPDRPDRRPRRLHAGGLGRAVGRGQGQGDVRRHRPRRHQWSGQVRSLTRRTGGSSKETPMRRTVLALLSSLALTGALLGPGGAVGVGRPVPPPPKNPTAFGYGGAVSSVDPYATAAGLEVLRRGGNAVDAAVATAAAVGVTEPYSAGIGGGGYFVYYDARTRRVHTLDGRETAPQRCRPTPSSTRRPDGRGRSPTW